MFGILAPEYEAQRIKYAVVVSFKNGEKVRLRYAQRSNAIETMEILSERSAKFILVKDEDDVVYRIRQSEISHMALRNLDDLKAISP